MTGWYNDPVWIQEGYKWRDVRGMSGYPPRAYIGWRVERVRAGIKIIAT